MVSWESVCFQDDWVAFMLRNVVNEIPKDQVVEAFSAIAQFESDAIFVFFGNFLCNLLWGQFSKMKQMSVINGTIGKHAYLHRLSYFGTSPALTASFFRSSSLRSVQKQW